MACRGCFQGDREGRPSLVSRATARVAPTLHGMARRGCFQGDREGRPYPTRYGEATVTFLPESNHLFGDSFISLDTCRIERENVADYVGRFALRLMIGTHQQFSQQSHHDALHTKP